jgi:hypothetical protein
MLDLIAKLALTANTKQLTLLAGMTDDEFMSRAHELRAQNSLPFRAVCAQRWAKITYPDRDFLTVEEEAWRLWGARSSEIECVV